MQKNGNPKRTRDMLVHRKLTYIVPISKKHLINDEILV